MNKKERVTAAIHYQKPDRIPMCDSFWEDTVARWHNEGLPENIKPGEFFDFDITSFSLDCSPRFKTEIFKEIDGLRTFRDRMGYIAKKSIGKSTTLGFESFPVTGHDAWQQIKKMFTMKENEAARIDDTIFPFRIDNGPTWEEAKSKYKKARECGYYILGNNYGPHEATWRLRGFEETLMDMIEDPEFIIDIASTYLNFQKKIIDKCITEGIKFDGFICTDDVAATNGMLFSPRTWRKIYKPLIKDLGNFLKERNIHFWMHCCGNAEAIFEDLIECGLQVINPLEVKSGLDVCKLKSKYEGRLAFYGNITASEMTNKEKITKELKRKIPLFKDGGFIFHSDHSVPSDVSFDQYKDIIKIAGKLNS